MLRRLGGIVCAAVLAMPAAAAAEDPPFIDWNPLLPGFPTGWQPSKEKDCADGSDACIERTLAEMYRRFDRLYASCDHNSLFGLAYIRVTEGIRKAVDDGLYEEPAFLNHEDAVFARMYFQSYDAWERGEMDKVPPAWRLAFGTARDRSVNALGNLLMSMNAHVNRDMPFMLANLGLTMPDGRSRKPDHDRGNRVLNPLYDDVLEEIAQRWDPTTRNYNLPLGTFDDTLFFQILQGWREQVWRHAELLVAARSPEARKAVGDLIEQYALASGQTIKALTTISDSSPRDAVCAEYQKSHPDTGGVAKAVIGRRGLRVRRGAARVAVECAAGRRTCAGSVALQRLPRRRARASLARASLPVLHPGQRVRVLLPLSRADRRALRRARRFRALVVVTSPTPWGLEVPTARRTRLRR
jgi:Family of unknown function (DUF5995)